MNNWILSIGICYYHYESNWDLHAPSQVVVSWSFINIPWTWEQCAGNEVTFSCQETIYHEPSDTFLNWLGYKCGWNSFSLNILPNTFPKGILRLFHTLVIWLMPSFVLRYWKRMYYLPLGSVPVGHFLFWDNSIFQFGANTPPWDVYKA